MKRMLAAVLLLLVCSNAYAQQATQSATIWFYSPAGAGQGRTVYQIGGFTDRLATLAPGQFFGLRVAPGVHVFSHTQAPARGQSVAVAVNQGQQAYVEIQSDGAAIVSPEKGIQAIQSSQPLPVSSAINNNVIVPAAGAPAAITTQATPSQSSAAIVTQAPAPIGNDPASVGPSDPNEFRRFEINWNLLSYQRQGQVNLYGGALDFTINANETVGIVADVGIHQEYIDGVDLTVTTYRFGPRFSNRLNRRVTLFTQLLAGGARVRGNISSGFGGSNVTVGAAGNGFSILGGAGLDIGIRPWFAIRAIEGGYSGLYVSEVAGTTLGWSNGVRISGGIVFRFGE